MHIDAAGKLQPYKRVKKLLTQHKPADALPKVSITTVLADLVSGRGVADETLDLVFKQKPHLLAAKVGALEFGQKQIVFKTPDFVARLLKHTNFDSQHVVDHANSRSLSEQADLLVTPGFVVGLIAKKQGRAVGALMTKQNADTQAQILLLPDQPVFMAIQRDQGEHLIHFIKGQPFEIQDKIVTTEVARAAELIYGTQPTIAQIVAERQHRQKKRNILVKHITMRRQKILPSLSKKHVRRLRRLLPAAATA